LILTRAEQLLS